MYFKKAAAFFLLIFFCQGIYGQRIITGKLLDIYTNKPVGGVAVTVYKGTSTTTSNSAGFFQLKVESKDSLLISHQIYQVALIPIPEVDFFIIYIQPQKSYPEYLQGEGLLYNYFRQNLKYPSSELQKGKEVLLFVQLLIDSAGVISTYKLLNDTDKSFEKVVLSVFGAIPGQWSASHQANSFIFPVLFKIGITESKIEIPNIELPEAKVMDQIIVYGYD